MNDLVRGERVALTAAENRLRWGAAALALVSLVFAGIYAISGTFGHAEFPFTVNSVAKDTLLILLSGLIFWDVRRWASIAVPFIVAVHVLMPLLLLVTQFGHHAAIGNTCCDFLSSSGTTMRWTWLFLDLLVVALFVVLHNRAVRARYDLRYLPPSGFRALMALAEVLVLRPDPDTSPQAREITAAEVGVRVDHYLASFRARKKYLVRLSFLGLAYLPIVWFGVPFYAMSPDLRERWIKRRFLGETRDWLVPRWWRDTRTALIRTAQQFCFFGYYGDERAAEDVGYLPFSKRVPDYDRIIREADRARRRVTCMTPAEVDGADLSASVVIVGTGAGGAMLAHELADRGLDVLMLERGLHVDPGDFTEDEAVQLSNLFADGALNLSRDFNFRVAQGMCVGGGTTVNNAVCFDLPADVRDRWNGPVLEAGLDVARLDAAFAHVREFLDVKALGPTASRSPGGQGVANLLGGLALGAVPGRVEVVDANIDGCLGSGYCNIGCRFGKKLSALDWTLPVTQQMHPGRLRILPECRVDKVITRGSRAVGVEARLGDGRRLTVRAAESLVLSAGALASSAILQRSRLGEGAGKRLSFNLSSPVTLDFDGPPLHAERGAQITHYLAPDGSDRLEGLAIETWWNPIVSQSLFMPGWFEEHRANMRRYAHMTCLGVVHGSDSVATVKAKPRGQVDLQYEPTNDDIVAMKHGVKLACEIGLKLDGVRRAMPSTLMLLEIATERDLGLVDTRIGDDHDLSINTSHPQGGNPMSVDPRKGVVDENFRVHGTENLYVCDASVFPSSITVNPQLTVMALAAYAADGIAGR